MRFIAEAQSWDWNSAERLSRAPRDSGKRKTPGPRYRRETIDGLIWGNHIRLTEETCWLLPYLVCWDNSAHVFFSHLILSARIICQPVKLTPLISCLTLSCSVVVMSVKVFKDLSFIKLCKDLSHLPFDREHLHILWSIFCTFKQCTALCLDLYISVLHILVANSCFRFIALGFYSNYLNFFSLTLCSKIPKWVQCMWKPVAFWNYFYKQWYHIKPNQAVFVPCVGSRQTSLTASV